MFMLLPTLLSVEDAASLQPRGAAAASALLFESGSFGTTGPPTAFEPHFEITIAGTPVRRGKCYDGQTAENPMKFEVSGDEGHVVVWDKSTSELCEQAGVSGGMYIHFAGSGAALPMTAGAGDEIHTYEAAYFETLPVNGTVCQPFSGEGYLGEPAPHLTWNVARGGSWCPPAAAWEERSGRTLG